jgi:hypothetical protein
MIGNVDGHDVHDGKARLFQFEPRSVNAARWMSNGIGHSPCNCSSHLAIYHPTPRRLPPSAKGILQVGEID